MSSSRRLSAPDSSVSGVWAAAATVAEESRRSHRGMSTPAQMATIATYKIALLNKPPLGATGADGPATMTTGSRTWAYCSRQAQGLRDAT
jgi:hypothetical protein